MQEPHFLREIPNRHLEEYKKNKNKTLSQRLKMIQERANKMNKKIAVATN